MLHATAPESARDVCVILSTALLADGDLDAPELEAVGALHIDTALGVPPERFRSVLHEVCGELLRDDHCGRGLSMLEPECISEALRMLNEPERRLGSTARLIDLMRQSDPEQLECKLLDPSRIDAALERIVDPAMRLWICAALVQLVNADDELHRNELAIVRHVLDRWEISLDTLGQDGKRSAQE